MPAGINGDNENGRMKGVTHRDVPQEYFSIFHLILLVVLSSFCTCCQASVHVVLKEFCNSSPTYVLDILADQGSPLLQDPEILPFTSYPSMQYMSMEPTMPSAPYYSSQNYYPPYNGDEWYSHTGIYELRKGPLDVSYDAELEEASTVVPTMCKRTRHMSQAGRVRGEELCVVCGDKASGYHYNALTCEGCKGEKRS